MDGMVNTGELSIHVVTSGKPKMLRGLGQKRHRSGYRVLSLPCHGHATLPANREHLTRRCQPCGTWQARIAPAAKKGGKPSGGPMAVQVWGWEKAPAVLEWDGDGLQHHPARKRADFPAVSRHENNGGIDTEGGAHDGGSLALVLPSPYGNRLMFSIVQPACCTNADGSFTRPLRGLSRMKGNFHVRF
jgi:hypothetical protein